MALGGGGRGVVGKLWGMGVPRKQIVALVGGAGGAGEKNVALVGVGGGGLWSRGGRNIYGSFF